MAKTGGAVKRLAEKAKHYNMLRSHGGFARFAEHDQSARDRRAGGAKIFADRGDRTIPAYDRAMVQRLEPGRFTPIRFGQERRREVTCYGNGTRLNTKSLVAGAQSYEYELIRGR
jgi:hypothetical protein